VQPDSESMQDSTLDQTPVPLDNKPTKDLPLELWDEVGSWIDFRRLHEVSLHGLTARQQTSFRHSVVQRIKDETRAIRAALETCPYVIVEECNDDYAPEEIDESLNWAGRCKGLIDSTKEMPKSWKAYEMRSK
jgi:hypothetical protein